MATTGRADIQGLRALAVLAVVLNHLLEWPSGGFVGVDVFFVISGYLITGLLLREHDRTGSISFRRFYVRRLKRVVPAAVAVLFVTVLLTYPLAGPTRGRSTLVDAVWAFFFAANWRFESLGTDYFAQGLQPSPLQHYWSLGVEEQFYLVWPWLMLGLLALGAGRLGWTRRRGRYVVGVAIVLISVASFAWAVQMTGTNQAGAYFSSLTRAWELGVGALAAITAGAFSTLPRAVRPVLAWVGLVGIVVSLFVVPSEGGFPAPWAALPVLATALVIVAGEGVEQRWLFPLTNRVSTYVGDISYSLYLWHFPVVVLLLTVLARGPLYYAVALLLMTALSVASFHLLEDPVRRSSWLTGTRGRRNDVAHPAVQNGIIVAAGLVAVVLTVSALSVPAPPKQSLAELRATARSAQGSDGDAPSCLGAGGVGDPDTCIPVSDDAVLYPDVVDLGKDVGRGYQDCLFTYGERTPEVCTFGVPREDATLRVALVGDSHAAMHLGGLALEAVRVKWSLDTYVGQGCVWGLTNDACPSMDRIEATLRRERYDIVLTSSYRDSGAGQEAVAAIAAAAARAWQPVRAVGSKIVVIADTPTVSEAAMQCVSRVNVTANSSCGTRTGDAFRAPDPLVVAARDSDAAEVVDLTRFFCTATICPVIRNNAIVYRDTLSHLSGTYAQTLAPYLVRAVRRAASA